MNDKSSKSSPFPTYNSYPTPGTNHSAVLDPAILRRIFGFVCPHATDETYANAEQASADDGCTLCDMRDLAHCAQVDSRWHKHAGDAL